MNQTHFNEIRNRLNFGFRRKVPQVIQTEASECGLASLTMVCRYHGMDIDLFNLRQRFGISSHGATLGLLVNIAAQLRMKTRALSLSLDELRQLKTPCILHWDMSHFVVLVAVRRSSFIIHDPAFGRRTIGLGEMSQHFTGVALELWPDSEFSRVKQRTNLSFTKLMRNVTGLPGFLIKIFCFSLVIEAINLLTPIGTQLVMDHVIFAKDHDLLALICIGLLSFILFRTFISMLRAWTSLVMGALIDVQWKAGLFDHLLRLPLAYFEKRRLGDIQARFGSLDTIRTTLTTNIVNGIIDSLMSIGLLIMMMLYGGWLMWVVVGFTTLYMILRLATYNRYREATEEQIVKGAKANSHFMETLYGISTLKALGLSATRSQFWLNLNIDTTNAGIRLTKLDMLFSGVNALISTVDQIVILWLGASMVIDGNMTLGMFVAFNAYRGQFSERAANLINMALQLRMLALHSDRVADIVFTDAEQQLPARQLILPNQGVAFEARDVAFRYDNLSKPIFAGLNISVAAGESVAITGPSGIGKTTLMKVMSGLLTPSQGSVLIDGLDITTVGLNNYRSCIACVLQDDKLFAGSIADNIACFDVQKDEERIIACAEHSNIHAEIMQMPMGYETLISELGGSLSGGQKQRMLIARALYRQPSILFLDEATSHLDLENEAHINNAISALQITRIFIAHRPSTIASADRIIQLGE
ncbi:peptidase domain-containing ABC transporter [Enterobacillus tribolii]|uniref:Colicin V processing peptidase n=1 Tax=Enterobacillus tribolii TaxID=1487935 RepID=A0A370R3B3_9GAMM|nr:peptidase domain-containing ABC transporter [Enterobacillus tribolii]MBW7984844.1 peptidase domain-containing ABC transporter [Enterobacillus tribolii]RDK96036.1 colicin V processing peptidase [Enterobacillus tribolii]